MSCMEIRFKIQLFKKLSYTYIYNNLFFLSSLFFMAALQPITQLCVPVVVFTAHHPSAVVTQAEVHAFQGLLYFPFLFI